MVRVSIRVGSVARPEPDRHGRQHDGPDLPEQRQIDRPATLAEEDVLGSYDEQRHQRRGEHRHHDYSLPDHGQSGFQTFVHGHRDQPPPNMQIVQ